MKCQPAWMKSYVSGSWYLHTNSERYLKGIGLAWEDEGSGTSAAISLCPESQPHDVTYAVGFLSGRGLGGRYHSWRMDALRKGRGLRGRYHSWPMDAHG